MANSSADRTSVIRVGRRDAVKAYLTDAGMTGAYEGIIGFARERIIEKFLAQTPKSFETAKRDIRLSGALVSVDETTGRATGIERIQVKVE